MNWNVFHLFSFEWNVNRCQMNWMNAMRTKAPSFSSGHISEIIFINYHSEASRLNLGSEALKKYSNHKTSNYKSALFTSFDESKTSSHWIECHLLVSNWNNRVRCLYWQTNSYIFSTHKNVIYRRDNLQSFIFGLYSKSKHKQFCCEIIQNQF